MRTEMEEVIIVENVCRSVVARVHFSCDTGVSQAHNGGCFRKNIINPKQNRIALRITTSDYCLCVPFNVSLDSGSKNEEATVKRRLLLSLLLGLVLVSSAACTGKQTTTQQLVKVTRGDIAVTVSGSGNLEVANDATPTFRISGRITKLYVKESDHVAKGSVLAQLDDAQLQLALTQARYGLAQAEL